MLGLYVWTSKKFSLTAYAFDVCHCLVYGPSCIVDLITLECDSLISTCTQDKDDFLKPQAFWTIAAESPGSQVQKVGAQEEQEQNQGESQFSALAAQNKDV